MLPKIDFSRSLVYPIHERRVANTRSVEAAVRRLCSQSTKAVVCSGTESMPLEPPDARAFQDFMKRRFRKPRPSWFLRMLGEPLEWNYTVGILSEPIQRIEVGGFFRRHGIFRVYVEDNLLQNAVLPGRGSFGLFSYDGQCIRSLDQEDPSGFEETLRAEGRPLNEAEPEALGSLFCQVLLNRGAYSHDVLRDAEQLLNYGWEGTPFVYDVNRRELDRVTGQIRAPGIRGDPGRGWRLEFTTIFGWAHEKQNLGVETFGVEPSFRITRRERGVLSKRIFAETPDLIY
jgi:hypothetical protein